MDLVTELNRKLDELSASIKLLKEHGRSFAQAEHDYKLETTKEVFRLREERQLPATLIGLVIYGQKNVADLRLKRDIAEVLYETNKEHINVCKLQIRIIESQIEREWGSTSDGA